MNIRKNVDYSLMYAALDDLVHANLPQMELYCGIGRVICDRAEKGAAVIAAEYLQCAYPDLPGFSPRNTRRMREFYRRYESNPALLDEAMQIGWTQNVVILEADLTPEEKAWYIRAVCQFSWSKQKLLTQIGERIHETAVLDAVSEQYRTKAEQEPLREEVQPDIKNNAEVSGASGCCEKTCLHQPRYRAGTQLTLLANGIRRDKALDLIQYTFAVQRYRLRRIRSPVRDGPSRAGKAPPVAKIFRPPKQFAA